MVFHVLGLISSIHSVMTTRTSQGTIAWVISLNTFPYVAVPAYWILGRSRFHGYIKARQLDDRKVQALEKQVLQDMAPYHVPETEKHVAGRGAEGLAKTPYLNGNHVELLIDGDATFDNIIQGIVCDKAAEL